jgi:hypothetical protein
LEDSLLVPHGTKPFSVRSSVAFATLVGIVSAIATGLFISRPDFTSDLLHVWFGTRVWLGGGDPYAVPLTGDLNPGLDPALYPLPAYLLFAPFAGLPLAAAGAAFVGLGSAFAAWGVARTGMVRAPLFLSAPFIMTVSLGQWGAWLIAAVLVPWLSWIAVAKPNVGLATWFARPSWRTAAAIAAIVAVSLLLDPGWLPRWLANVSTREEKFIPMLQPGGFLLLASFAAWRRPEGRLLLVMSAVPQALYFYDQLLLWLIPRTMRQSLVFSLFSVAAFLAWFVRLEPGDSYVREAVPFAWALYPAALLILLWNRFRSEPHAAVRPVTVASPGPA